MSLGSLPRQVPERLPPQAPLPGDVLREANQGATPTWPRLRKPCLPRHGQRRLGLQECAAQVLVKDLLSAGIGHQQNRAPAIATTQNNQGLSSMGGTGGWDPRSPRLLGLVTGPGLRRTCSLPVAGADWWGHGAGQGCAEGGRLPALGGKGGREGGGQSLPRCALNLPSTPQFLQA